MEIYVYILGLGVMIGVVVIGLAVVPNPSLQSCAQAHNVYKCEWVAMPVGDDKLEMPQ